MDYSLTATEYAALPGWEDEDPSSLFDSMHRCLAHMRDVRAYRCGSLGVRPEHLADVFALAAGNLPDTPAAARGFFEAHFQPFRISVASGRSGFVTAFYEPVVAVAAQPDSVFRHPFYHRPADLIDIDDETRPPGMDPSYLFGRKSQTGVVEFPDRQAIDCGALDGRGLEIAWAKSRVDVFFAHVQGAARLQFPNGSVSRITYAAKAGHAFSGIGRRLIDLGEIAEQDISMDAIRDWLAKNEDRLDEILWTNRSYIFFRCADVRDPELGPIAAAKVPLAPMRSIAVDRLIHTFSSPFYISSVSLTHLTDGRPFQRLMMALDTGSAILGPARGDIFTGSGEEAGHLAGNVRNDADFYLLVPHASARELGHGR
jgi:membrane-bound lytic murein transglycosylase A